METSDKQRVIGCDFDGTLAQYDHYRGDELGDPVEKMVAELKQALTEGAEVWIFTARVGPGDASLEAGLSATKAIIGIAEWSQAHLGQLLPITAIKSHRFTEIWDDRGKEVIRNTGVFVSELLDAVGH
jgi:hypothetical protein